MADGGLNRPQIRLDDIDRIGEWHCFCADNADDCVAIYFVSNESVDECVRVFSGTQFLAQNLQHVGGCGAIIGAIMSDNCLQARRLFIDGQAALATHIEIG